MLLYKENYQKIKEAKKSMYADFSVFSTAHYTPFSSNFNLYVTFSYTFSFISFVCNKKRKKAVIL